MEYSAYRLPYRSVMDFGEMNFNITAAASRSSTSFPMFTQMILAQYSWHDMIFLWK